MGDISKKSFLSLLFIYLQILREPGEAKVFSVSLPSNEASEEDGGGGKKGKATHAGSLE